MLTSVFLFVVVTTFYTKVCILSLFILGVALRIVTYPAPFNKGGFFGGCAGFFCFNNGGLTDTDSPRMLGMI